MFVITADQVGSRSAPDLAGETISRLSDRFQATLTLPLDRTAGDEIQALTSDAETTVALILHLTRTHSWSVGVGSGGIQLPLPSETRAATGEAFYRARSAVEAAKRHPTRCVIRGDEAADSGGWPAASDAQALLDPVLILRQRRSAEGWALFDLLEAGLTQTEAADALGISNPAVSQRARVADLKAERAAVVALVRLFHNLDK